MPSEQEKDQIKLYLYHEIREQYVNFKKEQNFKDLIHIWPHIGNYKLNYKAERKFERKAMNYFENIFIKLSNHKIKIKKQKIYITILKNKQRNTISLEQYLENKDIHITKEKEITQPFKNKIKFTKKEEINDYDWFF